MESLWYYRLFGEEFGPVNQSTLESLRQSGTLSDDDEVRTENGSDWQPLKSAFAARPQTAEIQAAVERGDEPEANWYYLLAGVEMGPLTFEEVADLAQQGSITAEDEVKFGATGKYRRVGSIGKLVAVLPFQQSSVEIIPKSSSPKSTAADHTLEQQSTNGFESSSSATLTPPNAMPAVRHHPAAEEPEWYAWIRGIEMGPTSLLQLAQWVKTGQITATDLVRCGRSGAWMPPTPTIEQSLARLVVMAPSPPSFSAPPAAPPVTHGYAAAPATPAPPVQHNPGVPASPASGGRIPAPPLVLPPPPTKTPPEPARTAASPQPAVAKSAAGEASKFQGLEPTKPPPSTTASRPTSPVEEPVSPPPRSTPSSGMNSPARAEPTAPSPPRASPVSSYGGSSSYGSLGGGGSGGMSAASYGSMGTAKAPPARPKPVAKKSSGGGGFSLDLSGLMEDKTQLAKVGGLAAVVLLFCLFYFMPASTADEQAKLESLQSLMTEYRKKRDAKASPAEWSVLSNEVMKVTKQIQEEYRGKATSEYPIRQAIMTAAQNMQPMIEAAKLGAAGGDMAVSYNLDKAAFLMGKGEDPDLKLPPPPPDQDPSVPPPP